MIIIIMVPDTTIGFKKLCPPAACTAALTSSSPRTGRDCSTGEGILGGLALDLIFLDLWHVLLDHYGEGLGVTQHGAGDEDVQ